MQVSELIAITKWINSEIVDKQVVHNYKQLYNVLNQNTSRNQQIQPFESEKNTLIETIKNINLNQLTKDQLDFLNKLNIAPYVGVEGVTNIEDILFINVIDISTAATKLNQIITAINQGIQKSKQIETGLKCCFEVDGEEENENIVMRVSFSGDAAMNNLSDLKSWGSIWYEIGRGIAMVHNATP